MENTNILIVEDEVIFSMDLKQTIQNFGFKKVHVINRFNDIVENIVGLEPDILIMDINLSKELCGVELVKEVLKKISLNVIYITGCEEDETIKKAVNTKPLAYLNKPIKNSELKAFLFLVLKHNKDNNFSSKDNKELVYLNDSFSFDMQRQLLYKNKRVEKLGTKESKLLCLLLRNKGKLVLFETIENEVWGSDSVLNDSIRGVISRLRQRIGKDLIKSVYSLGFILK